MFSEDLNNNSYEILERKLRKLTRYKKKLVKVFKLSITNSGSLNLRSALELELTTIDSNINLIESLISSIKTNNTSQDFGVGESKDIFDDTFFSNCHPKSDYITELNDLLKTNNIKIRCLSINDDVFKFYNILSDDDLTITYSSFPKFKPYLGNILASVGCNKGLRKNISRLIDDYIADNCTFKDI